MSPTTDSSSKQPLARGEWAPATANDIRGPCPLVNSLANHGYIPRDGRNVRANELNAAVKEVGLSAAVGAIFAKPIFLEYHDPKDAPPKRSLLGRLWYLIRNPYALLFSAFGMRKPGQKDAMGRKCLNLNQLGLPGVVEHDISLTRHDHAQGDNITKQSDLVQGLLDSSSDGGRTLTATDLAHLRKRRIERERADGHALIYTDREHQLACAEIALVLGVFGDGQKVSCEFAQALFQEERLPVQEGWKPRRWWKLGLVELFRNIFKVKGLVGMEIK